MKVFFKFSINLSKYKKIEILYGNESIEHYCRQ